MQPIPYKAGKHISRKTYRFLDLTPAPMMGRHTENALLERSFPPEPLLSELVPSHLFIIFIKVWADVRATGAIKCKALFSQGQVNHS